MTIDEAKQLLAERPQDWRDVWSRAQLCLTSAAADWHGPVDHALAEKIDKGAATEATNLMRMLVPLTAEPRVDDGSTCCCEAEHYLSPCVERPIGQNVLELYVRALIVARGEGWHLLLRSEGWDLPDDAEIHDTWPLCFRDKQGFYTAMVFENGTVDCFGPVCPPLPLCEKASIE